MHSKQLHTNIVICTFFVNEQGRKLQKIRTMKKYINILLNYSQYFKVPNLYFLLHDKRVFYAN